MSVSNKCLRNPNEINKGHSRDTGNIGHTCMTLDEDKQNKSKHKKQKTKQKSFVT